MLFNHRIIFTDIMSIIHQHNIPIRGKENIMSKLTQLKSLVKVSMAELTELHKEKGDTISNDSIISVLELPPVTQLLWWNGLSKAYVDSALDTALIIILDRVVNEYQYRIKQNTITGEHVGKTGSRFTLVTAVFDGALYQTIDSMDVSAKSAIYPLVTELTEWCEDIVDTDVRRFLTYQCYKVLDEIYYTIKSNNLGE